MAKLRGNRYITAIFILVIILLCFILKTSYRDSVKWVFQTRDSIAGNPILDSDGTIFAASYDGNVYALDSETGALLWQAPGGISKSLPQAELVMGNNGFLYIATNRVIALSPTNGQQKWVFTPALAQQCAVTTGKRGNVFVGADQVYACAGATGKPIWVTKLGGAVSACSASTDSSLYIMTDDPDRRIYALDQTTGKVLWKSPEGVFCTSMTYGACNELITQESNGNIYALNPENGKTLWQSQYEFAKGTVAVGLDGVVAIGFDGTVYVGNEGGYIAAYNGQTGKQLWDRELHGIINSPPAVDRHQQLFVGVGFDTVYVLNAKTGVVTHQQSVKRFLDHFNIISSEYTTGIYTPALNQNGKIYVGTAYGAIFALQGLSGK